MADVWLLFVIIAYILVFTALHFYLQTIIVTTLMNYQLPLKSYSVIFQNEEMYSL